MTDLDYIKKLLQNPTNTVSQHDQSIQSQIDKIISLIEQDKIEEAAKIIEKIFAKGLLDIRLVAYYAYAHFFKHGIKSFLEVIPLLICIVNEHWDQIKPLNRKEKQVQNSLNWLVSELIAKLKLLEKQFKKGQIHPLWELSTTDIKKEELDQIIANMHFFNDFFQKKWPRSAAEERLMHLLQILNDMYALIPSDEPVEELPTEHTEEIQEEAAAQAEDIVETTEQVANAVEEQTNGFNFEEVFDPTDPIFGNSLTTASEEAQTENESMEEADVNHILVSSQLMHLLLEKMRVFASLIQTHDHVKAAVVAKDIDALIANFDPLLYFPKLFSNHFALVARHVAALSEHWDTPPSPQEKYLQQLYKTDLDHFIKW